MKDSNFLARYNGRQFWQPMSNPSEVAGKPPSIIVGGEGVKIRDLQGRELIDAVGGLWNVNLGYSCSPIKEAITKQLENLPYYSAFRGSTNDKVIELAFELMEFFSQEGMARAFFTSGGSDSVETGLKLARQYHKLRGEPARTKFHQHERRIPRHAFRRCERQRQRQISRGLRTAPSGLLPHPHSQPLQECVRRG